MVAPAMMLRTSAKGRFGSHGLVLTPLGEGDYGPAWDTYLRSLRSDGSPTAYVFQCLHRGAFGGYSDFA